MAEIEYVPLLPVQRELQAIPRGVPPSFNGLKRFRHYLRTLIDENCNVMLPPLVLANPMAKEHVTERIDELLAIDADRIAAETVAAVAEWMPESISGSKVAFVVLDDSLGAWTNRYAVEYSIRFQIASAEEPLRRWCRSYWISGVQWGSEPADERAVREAIATALYRAAYVSRIGAAKCLYDQLRQEGRVLAAAGCTTPQLEPDDLAYTRQVLEPFLHAADMATTVECMFGDPAARSLGMTPRGLSPWAGLALALHDARQAGYSNADAAEVFKNHR